MLSLSEELKKVQSERDSHSNEVYLREDCWDAQLCPHCRSRRVRETYFHETSGMSYYKCLDCGEKGNGSMA